MANGTADCVERALAWTYESAPVRSNEILMRNGISALELNDRMITSDVPVESRQTRHVGLGDVLIHKSHIANQPSLHIHPSHNIPKLLTRLTERQRWCPFLERVEIENDGLVWNGFRKSLTIR